MEQVALQEGSNMLLQLGAGGAIAFLIIREVLSFLKQRKDPDASATYARKLVESQKNMAKQVNDMWTWYNDFDPNTGKLRRIQSTQEIENLGKQLFEIKNLIKDLKNVS